MRIPQTGDVKESFWDLSLFVLIFSNILSVVMAIIQGWDMGQILWVYWGQSVVIGIVNFFRIRGLKEFSTKNFKMNNTSVPETEQSKNQVATFFACHYGFFHLGYAVFLWSELPLTQLSSIEFLGLITLIFGFMGSHGFSYRYNLKNDFKHQKPNIGTLMFYPYLRIIPMHLVIVFGMAISTHGALFVFMGLKTLADAGMHMIEHHLFRKKKN